MLRQRGLIKAATAAMPDCDLGSNRSTAGREVECMIGVRELIWRRLVGKCRETARDLAAGGEEGLKDRSAVCGQNARNDFHLVIESGVRENFETRTDGAALGVVCAIDDARNAGLDDSAGAHAAGFNRDVERCAGHAVVAEETRCFTNHDDLGVGGRVTVANGAVAGAGEDFTVMDEDGANGDFACDSSGTRLVDGHSHKLDVVFHPGRKDNTL